MIGKNLRNHLSDSQISIRLGEHFRRATSKASHHRHMIFLELYAGSEGCGNATVSLGLGVSVLTLLKVLNLISPGLLFTNVSLGGSEVAA